MKFIFIFLFFASTLVLFSCSKNSSDTTPNGYKKVKYTFTTNSNLTYYIEYRIPNGQMAVDSAKHNWSYTANFSMDPGIPYGRDLGYVISALGFIGVTSNSNSLNDYNNDIPLEQVEMDLKIFVNGNLVIETTPAKSYITGIEYYLH